MTLTTMNAPLSAKITPSDVLRARARALAQEPEAQRSPGETMEVLEFTLASERYAFETAFVREVHPLEDLTPLPCVPSFVLGIVNVRGRILPVIDLKKFFDLPSIGITDLHRILLLESSEMELGILADTISGMRGISRVAMQPSLPTLTGIRQEYLRGVTAERLVILDAARILADRRIIVHEEVE